MGITVERVGRRSYFRGAPFAVKDALRDGGAKWDGAERCWWMGKHEDALELAAKVEAKAAAPAPAASSAGTSDAPPDGERSVVAGRATYKGSPCFVAGRRNRGQSRYDRDTVDPVTSRDGGKVLLYSRDGARQWWALRAEVEVTKTYDRPQTIAGLKEFAAAQTSAKIVVNGHGDAREAGKCAMCGRLVRPGFHDCSED